MFLFVCFLQTKKHYYICVHELKFANDELKRLAKSKLLVVKILFCFISLKLTHIVDEMWDNVLSTRM